MARNRIIAILSIYTILEFFKWIKECQNIHATRKEQMSTRAKHDQRAYVHLGVLLLFFACTVSTKICVYNMNNIEHKNDGE